MTNGQVSLFSSRLRQKRSVVYILVVIALVSCCNFVLQGRYLFSFAFLSPKKKIERSSERDKWERLSYLVKAAKLGVYELYPEFRMVLTDENGKCLFLAGSAPEHARGTERDKCSWAARQQGYKDWFFIHNSARKCNSYGSLEQQQLGLFVFLGGHFGSSCLRVRARGCRVVCVEPDQEMVTAMKHSALVNGWDVDGSFTTLAVAAGEYSHSHAVTSAWRRENSHMAMQTAPMLAIEDIILTDQDVEMLVIDIDGHDGAVLRGLLKLLKQGKVVRNIVLESWAGREWKRSDNITRGEGEALVDQLYNFGYKAFFVKERWMEGSFELIGAMQETDLLVTGPDPVFSIPRKTMRKILYKPYLFRHPDGQLRNNTVKHFWFSLDPPRRPFTSY